MKQISKFLMLAAVAAVASVSCNKVAEQTAPDNTDGIKITVTTGDVETKTVLKEGKKVNWLKGETLATLRAGGAAPVGSGLTESTMVTAFAETATFTGSVPSAGTYYAIFPWPKYTDTKVPVHAYPTEQRITAYNSFASNADLLVSKSFDVADEGAQTIDNLQFYRVCAFLKVDLTDGTSGSILGSQNIKKVTVTSDTQNLTGQVGIDMANHTIAEHAALVKYATAIIDNALSIKVGGSNSVYIGIIPVTFRKDETITVSVETDDYKLSKTTTLGADLVVGAGDVLPIKVSMGDSEVTAKEVKISQIWVKLSEGTTPWCNDFLKTADGDRNVTMDDDYIYIAESAASGKLWAIDRRDYSNKKAVDITGVSEGGAHTLSCARVVKNTDPAVNGGKDVLICSSLTRGEVEPKLYFWLNGIDSAPTAVTLVSSATANWYGDTFTVYGTLQNGILFFDKTDNTSNGVVTFDLTGAPSAGSKIYLHKRIDFVTAYGSHTSVCAYYPFPETPNEGVYSPGRGNIVRGKSSTFSGDLLSTGNSAFTPTLTDLDYAEGRNGGVVAYNYVEWNGKRYVIYGRYDGQNGRAYIIEGDTADSWLTIANTKSVRFRRDINRAAGCTLTSGNSALDVCARVIGDDLYIVLLKQNIGCGVYKISYE